MAENINLLPRKKLSMFSEERVLLGTKIAAVVLVVLVITLSILFFLLSRDPSVATMQLDQSQTLAQLNLLQDKVAKYLVVVDRVTKLRVVLEQRSTIEEHLAIILQQIPSDISIVSLGIDAKTLSLSLSSSNLSRITTVTDNFVALAKQKKVISSITIQGIETDEKAGKYTLILNATIL